MVWQGLVILGGLNAGDKVTVDNLMKLRPGAPVAPATPERGGQPGHGRHVWHEWYVRHVGKPGHLRDTMSKFFINRPIFASVISIIIVIAGLVASQVLPIAQYPQIAPPTVLITATYPGASAETPGANVAAPIEEQLNGVENMVYFNVVGQCQRYGDHHRHLRGSAPTSTWRRSTSITGQGRWNRACRKKCGAMA